MLALFYTSIYEMQRFAKVFLRKSRNLEIHKSFSLGNFPGIRYLWYISVVIEEGVHPHVYRQKITQQQIPVTLSFALNKGENYSTANQHHKLTNKH